MPAAPHVILDTNILVAAVRSRNGASHRVLSLLGTGRCLVHLSAALLFEYEDVLMRHAEQHDYSQQDIQDLIDSICALSILHKIHFRWRPALPDPDDDMILELAVASGSKYIVSFNTTDFAGSQQFGIRIVSPRDLLALIGDLA